MKKRLLLNFVYWMPVGHVVEAMKYAKGFTNANKKLDVYVALNSDSPIDLIDGCSWIKGVYSIDLNNISESINSIPKKWDYVVNDKRSKSLSFSGYEGKIKNYYKLAIKHFISSWNGYTNSWYNGILPKELRYRQNSKINLNVPKNALIYINKILKKDKFRMVILLAGSANAGEYPSIESWIYILKEIKKKYPEIRFYITGVTKSENGRTSTSAYSNEEISKLVTETDSVNCYDIGLWNQIALIKKSDIFFSPHTGFAFLAMCVNTPWLTLSGGNWPEYIFNDVPFYSVLPKSKEYPFYASKIRFNDLNILDKRRVSQMDKEGVRKRIPDLINGIMLLRKKSFDYRKAFAQHLKNIKKAGVNEKALFMFDSPVGLLTNLVS